jgi:CrcB protein
LPSWLLVACGGFLGSALRFSASGFAQRLAPASPIPIGTLAVNILGSLLIGLFGGLAESRGLLGPQTRLLLLIGLLGGFTTFSAFSFETLALYREGRHLLAAANVFGNNLLSLAAVWGGLVISRSRIPGI